MRYVIVRDDDTNALTPVECLERLYRPFLERGLPVNLAVIPAVSFDAKMSDGRPEGFLLEECRMDERLVTARGVEANLQSGQNMGICPVSQSDAEESGRALPIGTNHQLIHYLRDNPGFHIVQHGCHHDYHEFERQNRQVLAARLDHGTSLLQEAGFSRPQTFVAPYDCVSPSGLQEIAKRFRVFSTGWFELGRLPYSWWPRYLLKKLRRKPHWQVGRTLLLSHPGCLLSYQRSYTAMMEAIHHYLKTQQLTVLVTHWWEYFRDQEPDDEFVAFLHETAHHLARQPDIRVISFADLIGSQIPVN